jgi:hypothetical protein
LKQNPLPSYHQNTKNGPNRSSPPLVSSRPIGRPRTHLANALAATPPHLRGRS